MGIKKPCYEVYFNTIAPLFLFVKRCLKIYYQPDSPLKQGPIPSAVKRFEKISVFLHFFCFFPLKNQKTSAIISQKS